MLGLSQRGATSKRSTDAACFLVLVLLLATELALVSCTPRAAKPAALTPFRFDLYAILVERPDSTVAWLQRVFGMVEVYDGTEQDHIRWVSFGDNQTLHVIGSRGAVLPAVPKMVHLAVRTPDLDAFIAHLEAVDVPWESWTGGAREISTRPDEMRQVYVVAPGGYWIEVNGN